MADDGTLVLTVVSDNGDPAPGCRAEHGFACWIDLAGRQFLFDAGQDPAVLRDNCRALDLDPSRLVGAALSHGHYDHAGGFAWLLRERPDLPIWLHPEALGPHRSRTRPPRGTHTRDIGVPPVARELLDAAQQRAVTAPVEPLPGLLLFGAETDREFERGGEEGFCRDEAGVVPDAFVDEISLAVDTPGGLVVVSGCAHRGVVSIVDEACRLLPDRPLSVLLGGTHLRRAEGERTYHTAAALRECGLETVAACHCTGAAGSRLAEALPGSYLAVGPGTRLAVTPTGRVESEKVLG